VSRVFDALRKTGVQIDPSSLFPQMPFVDAPETLFQADSLATVEARFRPDSRLVVNVEPRGLAAEKYRLLRHRLQTAHVEANIRKLLITSPGAGEGKSTICLNLAASLSEKSKQNVLLIEADLRRPSLASELGLKLPSGLTECARTGDAVASVIRRIEPLGFYLLPAGNSIENPTGLLTSEWFLETIAKLATHFDWIIIDSPPAIPIADALSLKGCADSILLVARAGHTQRKALIDAIRLLGRDRILGIILNGLDKFDLNSYDYYEYYADTQ